MKSSDSKSSEKNAMVVDANMKVTVSLPERLENLLKNRRKQNKMNNFILILLMLCGISLVAYGLTELVFFLINTPTADKETSTIELMDPATLEMTTVTPFQKLFENTVAPPTVPLKCEKRVVAYFNLDKADELTEKQLSMLTHVIFYPTVIAANGTLTFKGKYPMEKMERLVRKAKALNVKTMISTDGEWNTEHMGAVVADPEKRKVLVNSTISIVQEYQLDGVDICWKNPKTKQDYSNLRSFFKELREYYKAPLLLSQLVPAMPKQIDLQTEISNFLDFLNIDVNNYYGSWMHGRKQLVGPAAPLFSGHGKLYNENVDTTMRIFSCQMKNPNKLNMLISADARYWNNVIKPENSSDTLWMTSEPINGKIVGGWHWWRGLKKNGWEVSNASWNPESKTPYIWNPEKRIYLAFENERSLGEKVKYIRDNNFGGIAFWEVNSDDDDSTLLKVMSSARNCSGKQNNDVKYDCTSV